MPFLPCLPAPLGSALSILAPVSNELTSKQRDPMNHWLGVEIITHQPQGEGVLQTLVVVWTMESPVLRRKLETPELQNASQNKKRASTCQARLVQAAAPWGPRVCGYWAARLEETILKPRVGRRWS